MELQTNSKTRFLNKNIKRISMIFLTALILFAVYRKNNSMPQQSPVRSSHNAVPAEDDEKCDIFTGEWIPNPDAPYYTNETCRVIDERQNCMKHGRSDTEYLKWKWKPDGCDLKVFDPIQFLDLVRDKSLAFVGDSVGRNQVESMICLLSKVEYLIETFAGGNPQRWRYVNYNFTLAYFWSRFLVRSHDRDLPDLTHGGLVEVYLDEPDESWTSQMDEFNYLVLNAGHWFTSPIIYYENCRVSGCQNCQLPNVTLLPSTYGYRRAFRTASKAIEERESFNGVVFIRTLAPSHFENGTWSTGGDCVRQRPWRSGETRLEGNDLEMYLTQMEEFRAFDRGSRKRFRVFDTTQSMLLRSDGHPNRFGHWPNETLYNDCVHWCLPGPIDTWADFLLHMIKMEARKGPNERLHEKNRSRK